MKWHAHVRGSWRRSPGRYNPFVPKGYVRLDWRIVQNAKPESLILGPIQIGQLDFVPIKFTRGV